MSRIQRPEVLFASAAVLWAALLPLAPSALPSRAVPALRFAAALVYMAGAVVCHQRPERSFASAAHPWPVCARCSGIYLGAAAAALVFLAVKRSARHVSAGSGGAPARLAVGLALVPAGLSLVWEWTTGVTPANVVRAATGAVIGTVVAWVVMRALRAESAVGVN